ncbi:MAG TPA: alpha/beta hydrolase [Rectinemataceae bacterium]|nr:alpha/beta hydrolase [Rectinemataceae bacterium]
MNDPAPKSHASSIILVAVLSCLAVGAAWFFHPAPIESAPELLESSTGFSLRFEDYGIYYEPRNPSGEGLIFFPEARVEPESYAWLGAGLAAAGHPVYIARFPFNFASLAPRRADAIRRAHPEVLRWALGGHSLGGSLAASYALAHQEEVSELILLAALPPDSVDLSASNLMILLVSASEDGLVGEGKIDAAGRRFPASTKRVVIQGGNHSQFGEYGTQQGDRVAQLDGGRQRAMTLDAMLGFMGAPGKMEGGAGAEESGDPLQPAQTTPSGKE